MGCLLFQLASLLLLQLCLLPVSVTAAAEEAVTGEFEVPASDPVLSHERSVETKEKKSQIHGIHAKETRKDGYVIEAVYFHNSTCFT